MHVTNSGSDTFLAGVLGGVFCLLVDFDVIACSIEKGGQFPVNHCHFFYPDYLPILVVAFLFTGLLLAIWLVALFILYIKRKVKND